jgi:hypothetical protein
MITATISHLYGVGELVVLDSRVGHFLKSDVAFKVIAQMPPLGIEFQYRIKSVAEPFERVASEHQLTLASPRDAAAKGFFKERDARTL